MTRFLKMLALAFVLSASIMAGTGVAWAASAPAPARGFASDRIVVEARGEGADVILIPGLASTSAVWARTAQAHQY